MPSQQQLVRDNENGREQQESSGWGSWWKVLVPVVAAASAAAFAVHQHETYESTRCSKHAQCPNSFATPEELLESEREGLLQPGDLIEFLRSKFQHWAVYIGNGKVVHLNNDGAVQIVQLVPLAKGGKCRVNNLEQSAERLKLTEAKRMKEAVVTYALAQVSDVRRIQYHVTAYNCEHFVTECFYGTAFSEQVDTLNGQFLARAAANVSARFVPYD